METQKEDNSIIENGQNMAYKVSRSSGKTFDEGGKNSKSVANKFTMRNALRSAKNNGTTNSEEPESLTKFLRDIETLQKQVIKYLSKVIYRQNEEKLNFLKLKLYWNRN